MKDQLTQRVKYFIIGRSPGPCSVGESDRYFCPTLLYTGSPAKIISEDDLLIEFGKGAEVMVH